MVKSSGGESKSNEINTKKSKSKKKQKKKSAYSSDVRKDDDNADIYRYPANIAIAAGSTEVGSNQGAAGRKFIEKTRAISLDSLANHSFGYCLDIMSNIHDVKFTVDGVNGAGGGSKIVLTTEHV